MANILSGKEVSKAVNEKTVKIVESLKEKGYIPTVAILRVGEKEDDLSYERTATKRCDTVGIQVRNVVLPEDVEYDEFYKTLDQLNNDDIVDAILMFRPLPKHLDNEKARKMLNPAKDIDGCTDGSLAGVFTNSREGFGPCTAEAAMEILDYYGIDVKGKNVVVIGRSLVVGKPLAMMLLNRNATVTICHTKTVDIPSITKKADIVIAATGQMESLGIEYFSEGQTVIDVGITFNSEKNKLCGDVKFDEVEPIVENITPVPGGVGSVTTSILINHAALAAERKVTAND